MSIKITRPLVEIFQFDKRYFSSSFFDTFKLFFLKEKNQLKKLFSPFLLLFSSFISWKSVLQAIKNSAKAKNRAETDIRAGIEKEYNKKIEKLNNFEAAQATQRLVNWMNNVSH